MRKVKPYQPNAMYVNPKTGEIFTDKMPAAERESYQHSLDKYRTIAATYAYIIPLPLHR